MKQAMCTSTCYWANIGRIIYAAAESKLAELTGEVSVLFTCSYCELLGKGRTKANSI